MKNLIPLDNLKKKSTTVSPNISILKILIFSFHSEYQNFQDAYFRTNVRTEGLYLNFRLKTNGKSLEKPYLLQNVSW